MRHRKRTAKLGRTSSHREAMISNMITSLFWHERIKTTVQKAKEARRFAEKAITLAKKDTLHSRRLAFERIKDEEVLKKLFSEIGPRFAGRNGGYTRIIRTGHREGDGAEMAFLELVDRIVPAPEKEEKKKKKKKEAEKEIPTAEESAAEVKTGTENEAAEEASVKSEESAEEAPVEGKSAAAEKTEEEKKEDSENKK